MGGVTGSLGFGLRWVKYKMLATVAEISNITLLEKLDFHTYKTPTRPYMYMWLPLFCCRPYFAIVGYNKVESS
jgi:hypothetical protein